MTTFAAVTLLLVLVLNFWASAVLCRANDLEPRQRLLQTLLVWFAPGIGAIVVLLVRWSSTLGRALPRPDTDHEHWQNAQDKTHGVE